MTGAARFAEARTRKESALHLRWLVKMPNYEIVIFIYDHVDKEDLKSQETIREAIARIDTKGTAKLWQDADTEWYARTYKEKSLKTYVDDENADYIKKTSEEIERANTEEALDALSVDEDYTEETVTELNEAIDAKREEVAAPITVEIEGEEFEIPSKFERGRPRAMVSEEVRATSGEILEEIVTSGEANDLEALRAIEIKNLPGSLKKFLEKERKFTISAVEEELRET